MEQTDADARTADAIEALIAAGAIFGYLHGSRATGNHKADSDIDIAAFFEDEATQSFNILLPSGVDLLVLNHAPLELAGRVAATAKLLFEKDAVARVRWESTTRKIYFDELPRIRRAHDEFLASIRRG